MATLVKSWSSQRRTAAPPADIASGAKRARLDALSWDGASPMEEDDWDWEPGLEEGTGRWARSIGASGR